MSHPAHVYILNSVDVETFWLRVHMDEYAGLASRAGLVCVLGRVQRGHHHIAGCVS